MKQPCVYIMASRHHGTLYTGVTSNLPRRAFEHREGLLKGFSAKYGCKILAWYELHETMDGRDRSGKTNQSRQPSEKAGSDRSAKPELE